MNAGGSIFREKFGYTPLAWLGRVGGALVTTYDRCDSLSSFSHQSVCQTVHGGSRRTN
jgi:hypothetical protein